MIKKLNLLVAVVVVLSLVLAACAPPAAKPAPKMGALVPLTGPLSEFGEGFRLAGDLAVKQLEEAGFPIEIKYSDTETSAIPGVEAARSLVDVENVVVLIGAAASGVTVPIAESVSIPSEVPQISNASTSPLLTLLPSDEGKDFLFRTCPSDALQGVILGKMAADEGYTTAAVLWVNNAYGEGLMEQFTESFELRDGQVIASVPHDESPAPTYVSELSKVMEGTPEALLALSYPGHATVYLKEFFEAGYDATTDLLFCDGTKSADMPAEIGPDLLAGFVGTAPGSVAGDSLAIFEADYEAEYGAREPLPFATNFYDAIVVAALAAAACDAEGEEITRICVRDHLRDVAKPPGEAINAGVDDLKRALQLLKDGEDINYEGAAGSVDFDDNGDVMTPIEVWQYVETEPYIETLRMETVYFPE